MKCSMIEKRLDEYDSGDLSLELLELMEEHIEACSDCQRIVSEHRGYRELMADFESPAPAPGQMARLLRDASGLGQQRELSRHGRHSFLQGFAMAASIAMAAVIGWQLVLPVGLQDGVLPDDGSLVTAQPEIRETRETREITVVINVPADMTGANLALELPAGMRIEGLEEYATVAWSVDLDKGANVLTLPVTVTGADQLPEQLYIAATIEYQDRVKAFQLPVQLIEGKNPGSNPELGASSWDITPTRYHI
jgi:hypothetical protein